jgi:N-acetylglucosaminyl-diphospho-decaprenol L-rhamnosyltransferase
VDAVDPRLDLVSPYSTGGDRIPGGAPADSNTSLAQATMTLSILVVSWNVRDLLRECLQSVYREMRLARAEWELVVVDNHSADGAVEMIRREYAEVCLIPNQENLGFGAANNQALRLARGRYILLLNPDTVIRDGAIDKMLARMEACPDIAVIGCRLLNTDGTFQAYSLGYEPTVVNLASHFLFWNRILPRFLRPRGLYAHADPGRETGIGWVSGACMLLRRSALGESIFDERFFMYGEDIELCVRLARAGWRVVYTPAAEVIHHEGKSFEAVAPEIQLNKLWSLRKLVSMSHGRPARLVCDVVILLGFLIRTCAITLSAMVRPSASLAARRAQSFRYLREAVRSFGKAGLL